MAGFTSATLVDLTVSDILGHGGCITPHMQLHYSYRIADYDEKTATGWQATTKAAVLVKSC